MADRERTDKFVEKIDQDGNPREKEALEYIKNHKIMELFDNFTAQLLYNRPVDPKAFLMDLTQKLIKSRTVNMDAPSHFDKSNIDSVFSMMDPTKKGMISLEQYKAGLNALGVKSYVESPPGADTDKISHEIFAREARKGVAIEAATYCSKPNPRRG